MSQRTSSAASWLASPPPSVAVEITATRVLAVALGDQGGSRDRRRPRRRAAAAGVGEPALNAANVHDERGAGRGDRRRAREASAPRRGGSRWCCPTRSRRSRWCGSRRCRPKLQDLDQLIRWQVRKAAPFRIEDAQVSWQAGRGVARRRPRVPGHRRAPRHHRELRAGVRRRRRARGHRRPRQLQPDQRGARRGARVDAATGCSCNVAADYATLAVVRDDDVIFFRNREHRRHRRSARSGAPDGDVSRGSAGRRRVHAGRPGRRLGARRRARPSGSGALLEERIGMRGRADRLPARRRAARSDRRRARAARHAGAGGRRPAARAGRRGGRRVPFARSRWPSAAHQPLDPAVLQRARRPRRCWRCAALVVVVADRVQRVRDRVAVAAEHRALRRCINRDHAGSASG